MYEQLSHYYDLFLDDALYEMYYELIQKYQANGTVLDLGCGTAPLAIKLAEAGYFVSGTDVSQPMLEEAYNNAVEHNLHIRFFIHDLLDPIANTYDIFTMSSDVINYVLSEKDVLSVFNNISQAMHDRSILVFDVLRPAFVKELDGYQETIDLAQDTMHWQVSHTDIPGQIQHTLNFQDITEKHLQQTYPLKTYKRLLEEADLYIVKKKKTKERIIIICKKL
ncbi:MAG: class I SAM-dependent methyltransferase [Candidatus Izemoplasma sp.]|nr:class I SAM-dependent methyltransferase [Candidatus Izemoplasma sp.]